MNLDLWNCWRQMCSCENILCFCVLESSEPAVVLQTGALRGRYRTERCRAAGGQDHLLIHLWGLYGLLPPSQLCPGTGWGMPLKCLKCEDTLVLVELLNLFQHIGCWFYVWHTEQLLTGQNVSIKRSGGCLNFQDYFRKHRSTIQDEF